MTHAKSYPQRSVPGSSFSELGFSHLKFRASLLAGLPLLNWLVVPMVTTGPGEQRHGGDCHVHSAPTPSFPTFTSTLSSPLLPFPPADLGGPASLFSPNPHRPT